DTAVYAGSYVDYLRTQNADSSWTVANLNGHDTDRVFNVERLQFADLTLDITGNYNTIVGTALDDTQVGTAAADQILGLDGDDTLTGAGGDDLLIAGAGDDTLTGGTGHNLLIGGDGSDTFVLAFDNAVDVIQDFAAGAGGDLLDLQSFFNQLAGFPNDPQNPPNPDPFDIGYARLVQSGADTLIEVARNGAGAGFEVVAT